MSNVTRLHRFQGYTDRAASTNITRYYGNCLNTQPPTHTPGVGCWVSLELLPITSAPEGFPNESSWEMFSQKIILTHHGRAKYSLESSSTPYDLNLKAFSPCQSNHDSRCTYYQSIFIFTNNISYRQ